MLKLDPSSTLKEAVLGFLDTHDLLAKNPDGTPDVIAIRDMEMFDDIQSGLGGWGSVIEAILLDAIYKNLTVEQIEGGMATGPNPSRILTFLTEYVPAPAANNNAATTYGPEIPAALRAKKNPALTAAL